MDDETLILLAYIKNAPTREKVLKSFECEDLRELELVYVINPEYAIPRLYRLTEKGKNIIGLLH